MYLVMQNKYFMNYVKGMIPIIVHPERNAELIERPDKLYNLVNKGVLTQVTAGSLRVNSGKD